jgi:hypothetical protein
MTIAMLSIWFLIMLTMRMEQLRAASSGCQDLLA